MNFEEMWHNHLHVHVESSSWEQHVTKQNHDNTTCHTKCHMTKHNHVITDYHATRYTLPDLPLSSVHFLYWTRHHNPPQLSYPEHSRCWVNVCHRHVSMVTCMFPWQLAYYWHVSMATGMPHVSGSVLVDTTSISRIRFTIVWCSSDSSMLNFVEKIIGKRKMILL